MRIPYKPNLPQDVVARNKADVTTTVAAVIAIVAHEKEMIFKAGDIVRFEENDIHGLLNDGDTEFVYISVTSPPIDFGYAYKDKKD